MIQHPSNIAIEKSEHFSSFPGGSKARVNKAGDNIRNGTADKEDYAIVEEWRAAHRHVLNTFQAILRNRLRHTDVVVAQRHKRKTTIFDKLARYSRMQLARMDDVAGCRLIFPSIDKLYQFREKFHKARFNHRRRNENDKYDYIKNPKETGYRGVHDVYEYDVNSEFGKHLKGLYVELQYRTFLQHAWSTAVELIGFITESQPKFEKGDIRYKTAMKYASEILARAFENANGALPDIPDHELVDEFLKIDKKLGLLTMLRSLNTSDTAISKNKNTLLIFTDTGDLKTTSFRSAPEALRVLFEYEVKYPNYDIVLVRADSSDEMRLAFKNYYSDAKDFIRYIEEGCVKLSGKKYLRPKAIK